MTKRVIHVGVGSFGRRWCREFLAGNIADGTIEVVARRRRRPEALRARRQRPAASRRQRCYTDAARGLRRDARPISAPSSCRRSTTRRSSTWRSRTASTSCARSRSPTPWRRRLRIARKVRAAGRKMAVTMSHRFDQDKTTLRQIIRSGELGRVNTVSCRYSSDMREHMAWGALFRHTMQDPLMIEGAVHHLDIVADLRRRALQDALCHHLEAGLGRICRRHRRHRDDDVRERRARRLRGQLVHRRRAQRLDQGIYPRRLRVRHRHPQQPRDRGVPRGTISGASAAARARGRRSSCSTSRNG